MYKRNEHKIFTLSESDESVRDAAKHLKRVLRKGDIILSGAILNNFYAKFVNIVVQITIKLLRGLSHSCIYLGNDRILDIDHKIIRRGEDIETVSIEQFIRSKIDRFGGVTIYVVRPRNYNPRIRDSVIRLSIKNFLRKNKDLKHSYVESLKIAYLHFFERDKHHVENLDLDYKTNWTCSHMVAYILKKAGTNIGNKASYTFVPSTFLFSKHFAVKKKLVLK